MGPARSVHPLGSVQIVTALSSGCSGGVSSLAAQHPHHPLEKGFIWGEKVIQSPLKERTLLIQGRKKSIQLFPPLLFSSPSPLLSLPNYFLPDDLSFISHSKTLYWHQQGWWLNEHPWWAPGAHDLISLLFSSRFIPWIRVSLGIGMVPF